MAASADTLPPQTITQFFDNNTNNDCTHRPTDPELVTYSSDETSLNHSYNDASVTESANTDSINGSTYSHPLSINVESLNTYVNTQILDDNTESNTAIYIPSYERLYDISTIGIAVCVLCGFLLAAGTIASVEWSSTSNTTDTTTLLQCNGTSNYIMRVCILGMIGVAASIVLLISVDVITRIIPSCGSRSNTILSMNIIYTVYTLVCTAASFSLMILTILHVTSDCRTIQTILFNFCFLSALFIGCIAFATFTYSCLTLNQQYQYRQSELQKELQRTAASRYIQQIPSIQYTGQIFDNQLNECVICCSEYELDQPIIVLECKHHYHSVCIKTWLKRKHTPSCPTCRHHVTIPDDYTAEQNTNRLMQAIATPTNTDRLHNVDAIEV